jgi:transcriptional regulator with XRE-family HTH domain
MESITTAEKIRILAKRKNKSLSYIAEKLGKTPANFLNQLARDDFRESDLKSIADALGVVYVSDFVEK